MDYIVLVNGEPAKKWYTQRYQGSIMSKMANMYVTDHTLPAIRYKSASAAIKAAKWVNWFDHPEVWSTNGDDELVDKVWTPEMEEKS